MNRVELFLLAVIIVFIGCGYSVKSHGKIEELEELRKMTLSDNVDFYSIKNGISKLKKGVILHNPKIIQTMNYDSLEQNAQIIIYSLFESGRVDFSLVKPSQRKSASKRDTIATLSGSSMKNGSVMIVTTAEIS